MGRPASDHKLSSLPLQIFIFFHQIWSILFVLITISLLFYKGWVLGYPISSMIVDIIYAVLYAAVDYSRLFLGTKGNKCEELAPLVWFIFLSIPILVTNIYFMKLQSIIIDVDSAIGGVSIAFLAMEILFGLMTSFSFSRAQFVR
eukprot:TRINITY_DN3322_c0_g1_i1.p1 TRINITY_DN3322_c0_g1~~TRINITY_DN3322_c0_g1_i1.p1  ORF type:complete len:167 (+),score=35.59 TRINITY_DN3322_c0_g1_i1:68-502(+)